MRNLLISTLLLGAAGAGLFAWQTGGASLPRDAAEGSGPRLVWTANTHQVYGVRVASEIEIDGGRAARYAHVIEGELHLQVFTVGAEAELGVQLRKVVQTVSGTDKPEPLLETFFVARADLEGRFTRFEFPAGLGNPMQERLRGLVRMFQVVVPQHAGISWTTEEEDAQGTFTAVYRRGKGGSVRKARVRYRDGAARIVASKNHATLSPDGASWLAAMDVTEIQNMSSESDQRVRVETEGSLRRLADEDAWTDTARDRLAEEAAAVVGRKETANKLRIRPATDVDRALLRELIASLEKTGKLSNQLAQLEALLAECPELAAELPALIARNELEDLTASTLVHALGLVGHDEAQAALVDILGDSRQGAVHRLRAVVDLGGVARPNRASQDRLWEMCNTGEPGSELSNTAMLALGRMGGSLRRASAQDYAHLSRRLVQTLQTARSGEERVTVITALGNTGDPELARDVLPSLNAGSTQERGAAAKALGRMPGTRSHLLTRLQSESSSVVRAHLAEGLCKQGEPTLATLEAIDQAITGETDQRARFAMARYLGENLRQFPRGKSTLATVLEGERSNRIRRYIAGRIYAK